MLRTLGYILIIIAILIATLPFIDSNEVGVETLRTSWFAPLALFLAGIVLTIVAHITKDDQAE